jgi:predicted RNA binding protein YcfA (HicA-like mRNA interferase family)
MPNLRRTLNRIISGQADANVAFDDLLRLLPRLGFTKRIKGSHRIFYQPGVEEILNLQPKGSQAKPYQVKQVRGVVLKHKLSLDKND